MKAKKQSAAEKYQPGDYWTDRIRKAIALDEEIKELKAELDEIKEEVKGYFGEHKSESRLVTPAGAAILKVANSYSVLPEWVPELKKIYKDDFWGVCGGEGEVVADDCVEEVAGRCRL